jgi:hypothetical protein
MPKLEDLVAYCDKRTRRTAFKDAPGAFNGLQVANGGRVSRRSAPPSTRASSPSAAVDAGVDFLIVHHGMYWDMPRPLTGPGLRAARDPGLGQLRPLLEPPAPRRPPRHRQQRPPRPPARAGATRRGFVENEGGHVGTIARSALPRAALRRRLEALYPQGRGDRVRLGAAPREVAFCSGSGNGAMGALLEAGGRHARDRRTAGGVVQRGRRSGASTSISAATTPRRCTA